MVEDASWLRKEADHSDINVAELEAVGRGVNLAIAWGFKTFTLATTVKQALCEWRTLILWSYLVKVDGLSAGGGMGNLPRSFKPECQSISALRRPWCMSAIAPSWKDGFLRVGCSDGMVLLRGSSLSLLCFSRRRTEYGQL